MNVFSATGLEMKRIPHRKAEDSDVSEDIPVVCSLVVRWLSGISFTMRNDWLSSILVL